MAPRQGASEMLAMISREGGFMQIDRRTMIAGSAALLASAPALARQAASGAGWYKRALVIDGLGGVFDPDNPDGPLRLTDREWADMLRSGVTAVNQTILPVGNR